jgi:membrane dipeptidase
MVNFTLVLLTVVSMEKRYFLEKHAIEGDSLIKAEWTNFIRWIICKKYADEAELMRPPLSKLIDHIDYIVKLVMLITLVSI